MGNEGNEERARIHAGKTKAAWATMSAEERRIAIQLANEHWGKVGGKEAWSEATLDKAGRRLAEQMNGLVPVD